MKNDMELTKQVTSKELSHRLENLGVKHDKCELRPIRLADILLAMHAARKNKTGMSDPYSYAVSIDGTFLKEIGGAGSFTYEIIGPRWDLSKDSIEDQTIEVQEFLGEILGV